MATPPSESTITKLPTPPLPGGVTLSAGDLTPPKRPGGDQWAVLAGLRFVLAFIVLTGHISTYYVGPHDWTYIGRWLNQIGSVFGFFLISGYSIAASLERESTGYLQRRINRIWPLYLASLMAGFGAMWFCGFQCTSAIGYSQNASELSSFVGSLFMLQSIFTVPVGFVGTTWTLSLEWWYYMAAPLLRRMRDRFLWLLIALSACGFVYESPVSYHSVPLLSMAWLWVLGFLFYRRKDSKYAALILCVPCLLVMGASADATLRVQTAATVVALIFCRDIRLPNDAVRRILNYLGDLSYPLYLIQLPVLWTLTKIHITSSIMLVLACVAASIVLVHAVDYPCRRHARQMRPHALKV